MVSVTVLVWPAPRQKHDGKGAQWRKGAEPTASRKQTDTGGAKYKNIHLQVTPPVTRFQPALNLRRAQSAMNSSMEESTDAYSTSISQ